MKIECVPSSNRKQIIQVLCDGDLCCEVHTTIFGYSPKLPKECESQEEFDQLFADLEYKQAKFYAIRRLSMQSMLSTALEKAMKDRLVSEKTIQDVMAELDAFGFLNDSDWTASFVRSQTSRKKGPRAIAFKLASKGVSQDEIANAVESISDDAEQLPMIKQLLSTRYRKYDCNDFHQKQKVIASLIRHGFTLTAILQVI